VYRRSPADLEAVYQQAGSVTAVADHYNVPRHTAQGWIRTLRRRQAGPVSE
jgi:transposase-like protein